KYEKKDQPWNSGRHKQSRMKQFRRAETEYNSCQKQQPKNADALIANSRHNRPYRPNKILRRMIRRRNMAKPNPRRYIFWRVGNQCKKQQCADKKQNESEDFAPSALFVCAGHRV